MNYLISNGKVVANDSGKNEPCIQWISSDDETIEIGNTYYKDGVFTKACDMPMSDHNQAIQLLLKLSNPVEQSDVDLKNKLMKTITGAC